jgi:hypothetical protein
MISRLSVVLEFTHQKRKPSSFVPASVSAPKVEDLDGEPLEEDVDGEPLEEDLDGEPLEEDLDGEPLDE